METTVTTKSLTQNRAHRTHTQIDEDIGKADLNDDHPLITCTPHVLEGRAHITATKMPIERILLGLMQERGHSDLILSSGERVSPAHVRAAQSYTIDIILNVSKVFAELAHLSRGPPAQKKGRK